MLLLWEINTLPIVGFPEQSVWFVWGIWQDNYIVLAGWGTKLHDRHVIRGTGGIRSLVVACWTAGQQVEWSKSYTRCMIYNKIHLISPGCPWPETPIISFLWVCVFHWCIRLHVSSQHSCHCSAAALYFLFPQPLVLSPLPFACVLSEFGNKQTLLSK